MKNFKILKVNGIHFSNICLTEFCLMADLFEINKGDRKKLNGVAKQLERVVKEKSCYWTEIV